MQNLFVFKFYHTKKIVIKSYFHCKKWWNKQQLYYLYPLILKIERQKIKLILLKFAYGTCPVLLMYKNASPALNLTLFIANGSYF